MLKSTTKKNILHSAAKIFSLKGYEGASLRDIAKDCNVGVSSIIYHFTCKNELFLKTVGHYLDTESCFNQYFSFIDEVDLSQKQDISEDLYRCIYNSLSICYGSNKLDYFADLYTKTLTSSRPDAISKLNNVFKHSKQQFNKLIKILKPKLEDHEVRTLNLTFWSQFQYIIVSKDMVTAESDMTEYTDEFIQKTSYCFAKINCFILDLPEPNLQ